MNVEENQMRWVAGLGQVEVYCRLGPNTWIVVLPGGTDTVVQEHELHATEPEMQRAEARKAELNTAISSKAEITKALIEAEREVLDAAQAWMGCPGARDNIRMSAAVKRLDELRMTEITANRALALLMEDQ